MDTETQKEVSKKISSMLDSVYRNAKVYKCPGCDGYLNIHVQLYGDSNNKVGVFIECKICDVKVFGDYAVSQ